MSNKTHIKWLSASFIILWSLTIFSQKSTYPNILWIVCEDISPTLPMYGDSTAKTPNLDALAAHSVIFDRAFATVGVCGPSRSSIITGMYPTSIGTMHMRTGKDVMSHGKRTYSTDIERLDIKGQPIIEYAAVLPKEVRCFTEFLREAGYYCTNNQKTDYQFASPLTAWDENHNKAHWRHRPDMETPFFAVFNFGDTHESRLWLNDDMELTVDPSTVLVPPYLPDSEVGRRDVARHYSNIELLDHKVGQLIQDLKKDGLYDETIIFFYSDHGGPLPRQKRETNDRGLRVPLMVKGSQSTSCSRSNRWVSFVDLAPTILSLAGIKAPKYMHGTAFLGKFIGKPRPYIYGSGDRFDETTAQVRAIRTDSFLYIRNSEPLVSAYMDLAYRKNIASMQELLTLKHNHALTPEQKSWFDPKHKVELYLVYQDYHNLYNVADNPDHQAILRKLSALMEHHLTAYPDRAIQAEHEMIYEMWPNGIQPKTASPMLKVWRNTAKAHCSTKGSTLAYLITDTLLPTLDRNLPWQLYTGPVKVPKGKYIHVVAERIGYETSEVVSRYLRR